MGPKSWWGGVGWSGYLRPDQFLDHLTVITKSISKKLHCIFPAKRFPMDRCTSEGFGRQHRVRQQLVLCRSGKCKPNQTNDLFNDDLRMILFKFLHTKIKAHSHTDWQPICSNSSTLPVRRQRQRGGKEAFILVCLLTIFYLRIISIKS